MDSESGPASKRFRSSLSANMQLTECVREFKLPRQYPSMVQKKLQIESEYLKRDNSATSPIPSTKTFNSPRVISPSNDLPINKIRTIKLKGKDGRDLGQVNVQDLPLNIQGKTITITKNGLSKSPPALTLDERKKTITLGNLVPLKIKTEDDISSASANAASPAGEKILSEGSFISSVKKPPCKVDSRSKVQLLRSGHNWHMVKIPNSLLGEASNSNTKNSVITKIQQSLIPTLSGKKDSPSRNIVYGVNLQIAGDASNLAGKKINIDGNRRHMIVRKLIRTNRPDGTSERLKFIKNVDNGESPRPKIEISRIVAPSINKSGTTVQASRIVNENAISVRKSDNSVQEKVKPKQDVMVVLPSSAGGSFVKEPKGNGPKNTINSPVPQHPGLSSWRRKMLANRRSDTVKNAANKDLSVPVHCEKKNEMTNNLIILEKALSSVEDQVLREKAMRALAECGIGIERLVPATTEQKPVKDSDTQTSIFGLWEEERFIRVPQDLPTIQRIPIVEKTPEQLPAMAKNPHFQDLRINGSTNRNVASEESIELNAIVEDIIKSNESTGNRVAAIFANPCPVRNQVVEQLQKDFESWNKYDKNGLLNIHNATLSDSVQGVTRHLMVLAACQGSADIPTQNGQTSLELAVRHDASPKIIKLLLDAGAEVSSEESGHDTALLIASKKSKASLVDLIARAKSCESLNTFDSEGFAALHYCAQNGNEEGVKALILASADINLSDRRSGRTALFHAIENNHTDLGQLLLQYGAEPNKQNYGGQTVFNVMEENKHYNLLEVLNKASK